MTQKPSEDLKLDDYEEFTFDPDIEANRVRREAATSSAEEDSADGTTVESSTIQIKLPELEASDSNFATLSPPRESDSNVAQNFYYTPSFDQFPYPPSKVPSAQHVAITIPPHHQPYLRSVKNYYDFLPSQPDYNYIPYCFSSIHHKFTPTVHDTWSNYRKWK